MKLVGPERRYGSPEFLIGQHIMSRASKLLWAAAGSAGTIAAVSLPAVVHAHCQVPCGIFNDAARVERLNEDMTTIRKAQTHIAMLAADTEKDRAFALNQGTRWVTTKETHADDIIRSVSEYFLAQRVKVDQPDRAKYLDSLAAHHAVMVAAMKCKQSADPGTATTLKAAIDELSKLY